MTDLLDCIFYDTGAAIKEDIIRSVYISASRIFNSHIASFTVKELIRYLNSGLKIEKTILRYKLDSEELYIYKLSKIGDVVDCDPGLFLSLLYSRNSDSYRYIALHDHASNLTQDFKIFFSKFYPCIFTSLHFLFLKKLYEG